MANSLPPPPPEPINYTLVMARLRDLLLRRTKAEPAGCMQQRISANHSAAVLWYLGRGRGYAVVWYDREDSESVLTSDYFTALDKFCMLLDIPPLDTRQPYAKVWQPKTQEVAVAAPAAAPAPPTPVAVPPGLLEPASAPVEAVVTAALVRPESVPTPPPVAPQRRRLMSQLETV
jgi:hypothetical protein